ncbi:MAG TPA: gamma carbonic anhydrase family protein, partial [Oligoflexia bacterium]|nr:gamma carbonic anhydrase family protein [Oligoflexia bacterium]
MTEQLITLSNGQSPQLHETVFLAPSSYIIGEVSMGEQCSVWFGSIIRGDVNYIKIGKRTNVQDQSMLHVTHKTHPLIIGDEVTIGHRVTLHGCTLEDRILVGMGATIMDGAHIESDVIIGAGAPVTPNTKISSGGLVVGSPAKVKREL